MISGYDYLNSKRFDSRRKEDHSEFAATTSVGSEFQTCGAATAKARLPTVDMTRTKCEMAKWPELTAFVVQQRRCLMVTLPVKSSSHTDWLTDWLTDWMVSLLDVSREDFSPTRIFPDICLTNWFENGLQKFESVTDHSEDYCRNYARN